LSQEFLEFPVRVEVTRQSTPASKVEQELYPRSESPSRSILLKNSWVETEFNRVMIFARSKENADSILNSSTGKTWTRSVIHSNKGQNSRINAMSEFKDGKLRVLVSTGRCRAWHRCHRRLTRDQFRCADPLRRLRTPHWSYRPGFRRGKAITFATAAEEYHVAKIESIIREKPLKDLPSDITVEETPFEELQDMARNIDAQKRREDPIQRCVS